MTRQHFLDLNHYAWRQKHGDIEAFGTWCGDERRPCMVLLRDGTYGLGFQRVTPVVILMDDIWVYDEREGRGFEALSRAMGLCEPLGLSPSLTNQFRVLGIIRGHMEDVIRIPPRYATDRHAVADFTMTDRDTGTVFETEVTDDA